MQDTVTVKVKGCSDQPGRLYFARMVEDLLRRRRVPASMIRYDTAYRKNALRDRH